MTKRIDILLTYWGDFGLLKKAVESVLAQSDDNWRLFVFDDCYPSDEARKYFKSITDERVTYYRHETNLGITNNFNYALKKASSEYCSFMGCDDVLLPNYVESALNNIGDGDFYQPGVQIIDGSGKSYKPLTDRVKQVLRPKSQGYYSGERLATSLCRGNWLYFPSIVWKTSVLQKHSFNNNYIIAQDVVVELDIIKNGGVLSLDNTITFQYRRFENSLSSRERDKNGVRFKEEAEVYKFFSEDFKSMGWLTASRTAKLRVTSRINEFISR